MVDYEKRARTAVRAAAEFGGDDPSTTPRKEIEENLDTHISTVLDEIWEEQGDKSDNEWREIREGIEQELQPAIEETADAWGLNIYMERALNTGIEH